MKKIISILLMFSIILVSNQSYADTEYKYINGNVIRWHDRHISVCIKKSAKVIPGIYQSVQHAMETWSSISAAPKLHFANHGEECKIPISMGQLPNNWDFKPLAINTISSYLYGEIDISEITINSYFLGEFGDASANKSVYDLTSVITHEMGHALGLEEEYVDHFSIMYEKFKSGYTIKRKLKGADIRSINGLYEGVILRGD